MEKQKSNPLLHLEREENVEAFCSVCREKFADMFCGLGGRCHDEIKREKKKRSKKESCCLGTLDRTERFNEVL